MPGKEEAVLEAISDAEKLRTSLVRLGLHFAATKIGAVVHNIKWEAQSILQSESPLSPAKNIIVPREKS